MIVRILGEGQFDVDERYRDQLGKLDAALMEAVDRGDERAFGPTLLALASEVRSVGTALANDAFVPSELVVPFADATLAETSALLTDSSTADEG